MAEVLRFHCVSTVTVTAWYPHKPQRQKTNKQQNKEIHCACSPAEAEEAGIWDLNRGDILLADSRMHRECWATKSHSKMLSQIQNVLENLLTLLFINSWTLIYNTSRYQIFKNMLRIIFPLNDELVLMFLNKKIDKRRFGVQPILFQNVSQAVWTLDGRVGNTSREAE